MRFGVPPPDGCRTDQAGSYFPWFSASFGAKGRSLCNFSQAIRTPEKLVAGGSLNGDPSHFLNDTSGVTTDVDHSSPAWLSCAPLRFVSGSLWPIAGFGPTRSRCSLPGFMSSSSLSPSRVAIALLCAGALAFACGPRTHSEAASTASLTTAAPVVQQGAIHARGDGAALASNIDVKLDREGVRFALVLTNATKKHVEL